MTMARVLIGGRRGVVIRGGGLGGMVLGLVLRRVVRQQARNRASRWPSSTFTPARPDGGCDVSGEVATAVNVGVRLGAQSLTPAQAKARLQPILAKVSAVAQQNAALPVGPKLQSLADAITKAENANPTMASQLRSAASDIGSAGA